MLKLTMRTCVSCRGKFAQKMLNRLQCTDKVLTKFTGIGRSFYICNDCLEQTSKLEKALYRHCKNKDNYIVQLKEILIDGR